MVLLRSDGLRFPARHGSAFFTAYGLARFAREAGSARKSGRLLVTGQEPNSAPAPRALSRRFRFNIVQLTRALPIRWRIFAIAGVNAAGFAARLAGYRNSLEVVWSGPSALLFGAGRDVFIEEYGETGVPHETYCALG